MFNRFSTREAVALLIATGLVVGVTTLNAGADESHAGHNHAGHDHAANAPGYHGGQVSKTSAYCFEVVYQPKETRIYLYDHNHRHLSMRGVTGQVAVQVRGNSQLYQFPTQYVATASPGEHDYLAVFADFSRVRDGDMSVAFTLSHLPDSQARTANFAQTFALSRLPVIVVPLTGTDQAAIARQRVCPVMGTRLGDHGAPIKVMVGTQPIYLCCKGCIGKLERNPMAYLARLNRPQQR